MRLSSLADYAVVLLAAAVRDEGARLTAAGLAERTRVPVATAQKLIGKLANAGILRSPRGAGGGFRLARDASAISLAEIVEAVEGPIALTTCVDHGRDGCALDHHCQVKPHWGAVNEALRGALASVSLASLASPAPFVLSPSTARRAGTQDKLEPMAQVEARAANTTARSTSFDYAQDERV